MEERAKAFSSAELSAEVARAGDNHAIAELRAAFVMSPGTVQALDPASLSGIRLPIQIVQGASDTVEPPKTTGLVVASVIPQAPLDLLPGVGHYDFLSTCTEVGRAFVPVCATARHQEDAHRQAIATAEALFGRFLHAP
jgi:predicted dienelactone hydrolase